MALANPAARFQRSPLVLTSKPFERRAIAVIPSAEAQMMNPSKAAPKAFACRVQFFTRDRVQQAVAMGEMRWCDKHHNVATFTARAAATWQKCQSGPVCTMQMRVGSKGRHIPVDQREAA